MGAELYLEDDATLATALVFAAPAGDVSAAQTLHLWFNKGTPGGSATLVRLGVEVFDTTWKTSGVRALDEHWFEARVNGGDRSELVESGYIRTPWAPTISPWYRIGTDSPLPVPDVPGNTARYVEVRLHPPLKDGIASETITFRLTVLSGEATLGVPLALTAEGNGILTGVGDRTVREFVELPRITVSGAVLTLYPVRYVLDGMPMSEPTGVNLTLNQQDGNGDALLTGEMYTAVVSQPPGDGTTDVTAVATKGVKSFGSTGIAPDVPEGNIPIAIQLVRYNGGGTSLLDSDLFPVYPSGRYAASGIGTPDLTVGGGRAILGGVLLWNAGLQTFTPDDNDETWYWLTTQGTIEATLDADPPNAGDLPLYKVTKTYPNITVIEDLRDFLEPNARPVRLAVAGNETAANGVARARMDRAFVIDRVTAGVRVASTGAGGNTTLDVNYEGVSIFGSAPSIPAQATEDDVTYPVRTVCPAGWLTLDVDGITTGGTRAIDIEVVVWTYPVGRPA